MFGGKMTLGAEIEKIRQQSNLPLYVVYAIFDTDERGYHNIVIGRQIPTIFQLILFIDTTHVAMQTIMNKKL